jgi:hypothetical protein
MPQGHADLFAGRACHEGSGARPYGVVSFGKIGEIMKDERNDLYEEEHPKLTLEFKDVVALSLAIFRVLAPKLLITLLALWLAGILLVNILG